MELKLKDIKKDPRINSFVDQTDKYLRSLGYTDHGRRHLDIVSDRSKMLANKGFEVVRVINKKIKPLNKIFAIAPSSMTWFKNIGLSEFLIKPSYPIKKIDIY